jgi:hypothetical protein
LLIRSAKDGDWDLVSWNPQSGVQTWVKSTVHPDGLIEQIFRYDTPINEANLAVNQEQSALAGDSWKGDWHHIGAVPAGFAFHGYLGEAIQNDDASAMKKWLNDSDNRKFRTKEGTV